ncbi:MAG: response regulator [Myxococcaceae bacterium]|nr:response regulator [Myxococcaceae bacterium]
MPAKGGGNYQPAPKRVLLACDDDELRAALSFALERDRHHVVELEDGSELLDYLDGSRVCETPTLPRPDAIIASLTMTGLGGLELLEALRRIDDRTPFIGLAEGHDERSFERVRALGAQYIFEAPLRLDDIREALHSLPGGMFPEGKASHDARLEACHRGSRFMEPDGDR